jgi:hypothetical protein
MSKLSTRTRLPCAVFICFPLLPLLAQCQTQEGSAPSGEVISVDAAADAISVDAAAPSEAGVPEDGMGPLPAGRDSAAADTVAPEPGVACGAKLCATAFTTARICLTCSPPGRVQEDRCYEPSFYNDLWTPATDCDGSFGRNKLPSYPVLVQRCDGAEDCAADLHCAIDGSDGILYAGCLPRAVADDCAEAAHVAARATVCRTDRDCPSCAPHCKPHAEHPQVRHCTK